MTITISEFKTRVANKIHGQNLSKVQDVNGLIYEAAGNVLSAIDPVETKRTANVTNGLYDSVYEYICPSDLKKDRIIDIRPIDRRYINDNLHLTTSAEFDRFKTNNSFAIESKNGLRTVRISKDATAGIVLNTCDSLTNNGTWAVSSDASNLQVDSINKLTGAGSLSFDLDAAGTSGVLTNSTMESVDVSDYPTEHSVFVPVYIPSTSISSITLKWGSSDSNYYSKSVTVTQDNNSFFVGWNTLRFDRSSATETGTVDDSAIVYSEIIFTYSSATIIASVRVDSITFRQPSPYEILYYSRYLFTNNSGTWIEKPTAIDDSDIVQLDVDGINILLYEVCYLIAQELAGEDSTFDSNFWETKRDEAWDTYKSANKTEAKKPRVYYYRTRRMNRR